MARPSTGDGPAGIELRPTRRNLECRGAHSNTRLAYGWHALHANRDSNAADSELRVGDGGEIAVALNPDDPRIRGLRERRDCPGLVHIISAYVAQYAALSEANARQVLRAGIVRAADPGLREHELYAYYYDRVDQPAVAHEER